MSNTDKVAEAREPSAEQLREADELGSGFGLDCGDHYQLTERQLARLIAYVRHGTLSRFGGDY